LAAIAESDAIAPFPSFTTTPGLIRIAEDHAAAIAEAKARVATLSHDDAVALLLDTIDRAVAEHGSPNT